MKRVPVVSVAVGETRWTPESASNAIQSPSGDQAGSYPVTGRTLGLLPSTFRMVILLATYASRLPSGDHVGLIPGAIVSVSAPVVALTITTMKSFRVAAIARPSGDHRGGRT